MASGKQRKQVFAGDLDAPRGETETGPDTIGQRAGAGGMLAGVSGRVRTGIFFFGSTGEKLVL